MITMFKYYKVSNLQEELAELEKKILRDSAKGKAIDLYDLKSLEGLSNEIAFLIGNVNE